MERIIKVGEYEFAAKSTAASLFSYKRNFNRDGLKDLIALTALTQGMPNDAEGDIVSALVEGNFDFDTFFRFLWVFARAANPEIPPLERWLEGFDMPPIDFAVQALTQSMDLLFDSAKTSVKPKNHPAAAVKK
jgi:hypothetical protein